MRACMRARCVFILGNSLYWFTYWDNRLQSYKAGKRDLLAA